MAFSRNRNKGQPPGKDRDPELSFLDREPAMDREILDIIPERYDADPDSRFARKTAHTRLILTVALGLLAVAAIGVAARHIFFGPKHTVQAENGVPLIKADDKPVKTKPAPEDRGGMNVPNRDKLVYERMGNSESLSQSERLLPPPEAPAAPPRSANIKPAFQTPPPKEINTANLPPDPPKPGKTPPAPAAPAPAITPPAATAPLPAAPAAKAAPAPAPTPAPTPAKSAGGGWHVRQGRLL